MPLAKLDFNRIWASSGDPADTIDPQAKYLLGWTAEIPPHEYFNYITQDFSLKFQYWNENGIPEWDGVSEFKVGSLVTGGIFAGGIFVSKTDGVTSAPPDFTNDFSDRIQNDDWLAYPSYNLSDNTTEPYYVPLNKSLVNLSREAQTSPVQPVRTFEQFIPAGASTDFDDQLQLPYLLAGTYSFELFLIHNSDFNGSGTKSQLGIRGYSLSGSDQNFDLAATHKDSALVPFGSINFEEQVTETLLSNNQIGVSISLGASDVTQLPNRSFRLQGTLTLETSTQIRIEYEQMSNRSYSIYRGSYIRAELIRPTLPLQSTLYVLEDDTIWSDSQMTWNSVDGRWERPATGPALSVLTPVVDFNGFKPTRASLTIQIPTLAQDTWVRVSVKNSAGSVMHYRTAEFTSSGQVIVFEVDLPDTYTGGTHLGDIEILSEHVDTELQVNTIAFDRRFVPPVLPATPVLWGPMVQGLNSGTTTGQIRSLGNDGSDVWVAGFSTGHAARSDDNGETWSALPFNLNNGGSPGKGLYAFDSDGQGVFISVAVGGYASRSTDNGITWTALPQGLVSNAIPQSTWSGLATDKNGVWVAVGINGAASRSTDNGVTWAALPNGLNSGGGTSSMLDVATDGNGVWLASSALGWSSRSVDNGATWSPLLRNLNSGAPDQNIQKFSTDGNGIWLAVFNEGYVARSTDNGANWAPLIRGINSGGPVDRNIYTVAADGAGNWAAGFEDGYAVASSDDGATWSPLTRGLNSGSGTSNTTIWAILSSGNKWMAGFSTSFAATSPPPPGFVIPGPQYQQTVLADDPIALFMLQDTDTNAEDLTGTFLSAITTSVPSPGGQIDGYTRSLTLTGNNSFSSVNNEGIAHTWPFWAIEFWYTPSGSTDGDRIIDFLDKSGNGNNLSLRVGKRADGSPFFELRDSGVITSTFDGPVGTFTNGQTYHVVAQGKFDQGSPYEYVFELLVNAVTVMSIIQDVASPDTPPADMLLRIQANFDNSPPDLVSTVSGVSIWDKMLTPTQVLTHYVAGQP